MVGTPLRPTFLLAIASLAMAQQPTESPNSPSGDCPGASIPVPPVDPDESIFILEAPITAYNVVERTITAGEMTLVIPHGLLIDVDGDGIGDITLDFLLDPLLEAQRTIIGGTAKGNGDMRVRAGCATFVPTTLMVEMAEHVVVGPLTTAAPGQGEFRVAGVPFVLNSDPRFPRELTGAGGSSVALTTLPPFVGTLAEVEGYFEKGVLQATHVETCAFETNPFTDTVILEEADWDPQKQAMEVKGFASVDPITGQFASGIDLWVGPSGAACSTTFVTVMPTTLEGFVQVATFKYKSPVGSYPIMPGEVCAKSPFGGQAARAVVVE